MAVLVADQIAKEAELLSGGLPCVWHDQIPAAEVAAAAGGRRVIEITAPTADAAVAEFAGRA